jgi:hypothetical protein
VSAQITPLNPETPATNRDKRVGGKVGVIECPVSMQSNEGKWVVLALYKEAIVVLMREEFVQGLKRGKAWRRPQSLQSRTAPRAWE